MCELYKLKIETPTHYVGRTGTEYRKSEYINHGHGVVKYGFKDLPKHDYPYTITYEVKPKFKCCELCSCDCKL